MEIAQYIQEGKAVLGIEFGSTRIKAVLIGEQGEPLASGSHNWENRLEDGVWTYHEEDIWNGLADCYRSLAEQVQQKYQVTITKLAAIGFSAMMHGYLAFDAKGDFLVPFRTWRNTMTEEAADALLLQKHLLMLTERRRLTELTFQSSVKFRLIRITTDNQS